MSSLKDTDGNTQQVQQIDFISSSKNRLCPIHGVHAVNISLFMK
jgi:hypothetical protein